MKNNKVILETERLILRPFTLDDLDASYEMNLDPEVSRFTGDGGVISKDELKRRIEEDVMGDYKKYGYGRFAVELKENNKFIGFSGLKYLPEYDVVDLGYRFIKKYWGRGYATESCVASVKFGFETLKLEDIIGLVLSENIASIRVLTKLGFLFDKEVVEDGLLAHQYILKNKSPHGKMI